MDRFNANVCAAVSSVSGACSWTYSIINDKTSCVTALYNLICSEPGLNMMGCVSNTLATDKCNDYILFRLFRYYKYIM